MTYTIKGNIFTPFRVIENGVLIVENGKVKAIEKGGEADFDYSDCYIVPGFIDIHIHGGGGEEFKPGADFKKILDAHTFHGTTSFVLTALSMSFEEIMQLLKEVSGVDDERIIGVNLEGPYINPDKKGAQPAEAIRKPSLSELEKIVSNYPNLVKIQTIAPELEGALEYIHKASRYGIRIFIGHTNATFEQAEMAIEAGACGATHLFNAHTNFHHRRPGSTVAALVKTHVWVELIADNIHVSPHIYPLLWRLKRERLILITDAISAACLEDGEYSLGEQAVEVKNGIAKLKGSETLAGSTLTLDRAIKNMVEAGLPFRDALFFLTVHPARLLNLKDRGHIEPGARADIAVIGGGFEVRAVFVGGKKVK